MSLQSDSAKTAIARLITLTENPQSLLSKIGFALIQQHKNNIEAQQAPDKTPWKPKRRGGRGRLLGGRPGAIASSLYYRIQGNTVVIGYGNLLATTHHHGATIPPRRIVPRSKQALFWAGAKHPAKGVDIPAVTIPARPLIGVGDGDVRMIQEMVRNEYWRLFLL